MIVERVEAQKKQTEKKFDTKMAKPKSGLSSSVIAQAVVRCSKYYKIVCEEISGCLVEKKLP